MKKILSLILVFFILLCMSQSVVSATDDTVVYTFPSNVTVSIIKNSIGSNESWGKNMVRNPYYQQYYNELLNYSCQLYEKVWKQTDNTQYINSYAKQYLVNPENYATLILKKPETQPENINGYNINILKKYFEDEEILYVSDYDYAAVVSIAKEKASIVSDMAELEFIGNAFFTNQPSVLMCATGIITLGNVDNNGSSMGDASDITAADARYLLRYAAGLQECDGSKYFYFSADMNFDNKIDAADARLALRTAADLEPAYYVEYSYFQYWTDFMGVISNEK